MRRRAGGVPSHRPCPSCGLLTVLRTDPPRFGDLVCEHGTTVPVKLPPATAAVYESGTSLAEQEAVWWIREVAEMIRKRNG